MNVLPRGIDDDMVVWVARLATSIMSVARYYSWLTWFQQVVRVAGHDTGQRTLTVHRLLRDADGQPSGDVLHERVLRALTAAPLFRLRDAFHVLDAGCGLGGTTFFLQSRLGGRYVGITLSPDQCERASREATERGLTDVCRFAVRSYDDTLTDLLPTGADIIAAIESLAHAPDPAGSLARLARLLAPGGYLVVVDDVPAERLDDDDPDFAGFRRGWLCPAAARASTLTRAFEESGLERVHDENLTPLMRLRDPRRLAFLVRLNRAATALLRSTPVRVLLDSLYGGLMLERLYERGEMQYRLFVARKPPAREVMQATPPE
jgi:SAM-dependent methyltransferase